MRLTQSLSFLPAGIPISSKVAGPVFLGGPEDVDPPEGVTDPGPESGLDCDDTVCCGGGGRCDARLGF